LRVALDNLLSNAWKFTSKRNDPRIELGVAANGGAARTYFVRDNGVGFDAKGAGKLFSPFERLQNEFPGSGIGLATVQRIIHRHGGRVWADAAANGGATFFFTLGNDAAAAAQVP
jgi:signal transduction histidine kinase